MTENKKPGRKPMDPAEKCRNFTTKLSPEWRKFLDEMVEKGHTKAAVINKGLELVRKYIKKGGKV